MVGLLAGRKGQIDIRDVAAKAFCLADTMIRASGEPYCYDCGAASDLLQATKGGVLVYMCRRCAGEVADADPLAEESAHRG